MLDSLEKNVSVAAVLDDQEAVAEFSCLPEEADPGTRASAPSSASKTLAVLEVVARARGTSFGVTEIASMVGVPKSTAHRLLKTLEAHGFVARTGTRYRAGGRVFELSEAAQWSEFGVLRSVAPQPMAWLFERSGAIAVHLAVLQGRDVLYLDKINQPAGTRLPSRVGGRFPASCTALGKAMLAYSAKSVVLDVIGAPMARPTPYSVAAQRQLIEQLRHVREAGYAVEREEACQGAVCIGAPVLRNGQPVAAVSASLTTSNAAGRTGHQIAHIGRLVGDAASRLSGLLPDDGD